MKEVQGKVKMLFIPIPKDADEFLIIHEGTRVAFFMPQYKKFNIPKNKCTIVNKLSKITEEQCDELVDFCLYDSYDVFPPASDQYNYFNYIDDDFNKDLGSKDSLETLMKVNNLFIKEWYNEPNPIDFDIFGLFDAADRFDEALKDYEKLPDDYLILKVTEDDVCKKEIGQD